MLGTYSSSYSPQGATLHRHVRCLIKLDEPDAAMSQDTTDSFKNLLAVMNKVIPTIVVITPRTEQRYQDAKEYTVVKNNGRSSIVKGHPSVLINKKRKT